MSAQGPSPVEMTDEDFLAWKKKKRGKEKPKLPGSDITSLNLTPLMDIMSILLVFLIQSLAVEPSNINTSLALQPPESSAEDTMAAATRVTISDEEIVVEDKPIAGPDGDPRALMAQLKSRNTDESIPEIRDALIASADQIRAMKDVTGKDFEGKLNVVSHGKVPYKVVASVLKSAGEAQFSTFQLVVMKKNDAK
jgi:biopolymer transport protein ExbD